MKYSRFIKSQEGFVVASMSRPPTPTDNAVAERFIRTFKEHKINNKTFQQELFYQIAIISKFRGYKKISNMYVKSLNLKPNLKSKSKSPQQHNFDASTASMLMVEPKHPKAFSELYGFDYRRDSIEKFKSQNNDGISI